MKRPGRFRLFPVGMLMFLLAGWLAGCSFFGGTAAKIEVSPPEGIIPLIVTFDGTASTGSGGISTYHWTFGTGDESYQPKGTYAYNRAGTFTLTLTVRSADGSTATKSLEIVVAPAVWITDSNLSRVYKLDMDGNVLLSFDAPGPQPQGIAVAEADGQTWLFLACQGEGTQRIYRLDPSDGDLSREFAAPAQSPREPTYAADNPKRIWCVDGTSRKLYALNPANCQILESFGINYFTLFPQVRNVAFLRTPNGLDWTAQANASGHLWYLEGDNHLLFKMKIVPSYDLMSGTQLEIVGDPLYVPVFAASAIDWYDGFLWVVDSNEHEIVQIDPETGSPTGVRITGLPGSNTTGMEIQE